MISGAGLMWARLARRPVLRASRTRTRRPGAVRASTRWEPMKPAPPVTRQRSGMGPSRTGSGEQRLDVGVGVEGLEVVELLADADELDGQVELLLDGED